MNELQLQVGPYRTTFIGTEIIRSSTKKEWESYGEILKRVDEAKQWAIGDWLVDGKKHYGDGLYEEAERITGIDQGQLRKLKSISDNFELLRRSNNLTWSHHYEIASLKQIESNKGKLRLSDKADHKKMQEFLTKGEKEKWSVRDLKEAVAQYKRRQDEEIRLANEPEKYSIILADPAWEYDFSRSPTRDISNQYLPSTLEDMKRLKIPAAEDCILFMWATSPKIPEGIGLMQAWGFEYKTCMVWVKDKIGMGYYARQKHELLFIGGRGNLQLPDDNKKPESVFFADRAEHSEKPKIAYEIIESMFPEYKRLEMFARSKQNGWDSWGDEAN